MATIQEIRRELDKDELNYTALAAAHGEAILPQLKAIVVEDVPRLASKAAYLAGLLGGDTSHEIVGLAARSRHDVVRVSAAAVAASLPTQHAVAIVTTLLRDADPGVRARATKSAAKMGDAALNARIREIAADDADSHVRALAADLANVSRMDGTDGTGTDSVAAKRMRGGDMTEGASTGKMPGVEAASDETARRIQGEDMTEGAATGRMPGVEAASDATAGEMQGGVMTEGAALGRMPGVETGNGTAAGGMQSGKHD